MQVLMLSLCDCLMQTYPWEANALPEDRKLTQKIIGNYSGPGGDLTPVPDFYHMFAVEHNKPMAICETGAMFNTQADATVDAYHMKIKWLEQVTDYTSCIAVYILRLEIFCRHTAILRVAALAVVALPKSFCAAFWGTSEHLYATHKHDKCMACHPFTQPDSTHGLYDGVLTLICCFAGLQCAR